MAFLLLFSGCLVEGVLGSGDKGELDAQREKWRAAEIVNYVYQEDRMCFCGLFGPAEVTVVNGVIVSVRRLEPDAGDVNANEFQYFHTVEGLFDMVAEAIATNAHQLDVTYDERFGFPSRIAIDYIENAIDDEITVTATLFAATVN